MIRLISIYNMRTGEETVEWADEELTEWDMPIWEEFQEVSDDGIRHIIKREGAV